MPLFITLFLSVISKTTRPSAEFFLNSPLKISDVLLLCDRLEKHSSSMSRGCIRSASREGADGGYETPPASELQRLMWTKKGTSGHLDEVQPRIYIGDM